MKYTRKPKLSPAEQARAELKKINWKLYLLTFLCVALSFGVYQLAIKFEFGYIIHIYAALLFVCSLCYGIFNRGFLSKAPEALSFEEKEAWNARHKKAKYFLIPVIAILLTFAFDFIYLYYLEPLRLF